MDENSRWEFYDRQQAFPTVWRPAFMVVQEMGVSLAALTDAGEPDGSLGEFSISWLDLSDGRRRPCPKVEAFADAWRVIWSAGIFGILESLSEDPTYDQIAAEFVASLGAVDTTDRWRVAR